MSLPKDELQEKIKSILVKTKERYPLSYRKEGGKDVVTDAIHLVDIPKASVLIAEAVEQYLKSQPPTGYLINKRYYSPEEFSGQTISERDVVEDVYCYPVVQDPIGWVLQSGCGNIIRYLTANEYMPKGSEYEFELKKGNRYFPVYTSPVPSVIDKMEDLAKPSMKTLMKLSDIRDNVEALIQCDLHEDIVESILKPIEAELIRNGVNLSEQDF